MFGVGVMLAGCALRTRPATIEDGRQMYVALCASCHGRDGNGDGPVGPLFKAPPPDLTRLTQRYGSFPRALVIATVTGEVAVPAHGTREMPVWGQRFGPRGTGATAAAALYQYQRLEMLAGYIESVQHVDRH